MKTKMVFCVDCVHFNPSSPCGPECMAAVNLIDGSPMMFGRTTAGWERSNGFCGATGRLFKARKKGSK